MFMSILDENGAFPALFQQDRAPPYYGIEVRRGAVGWTSSFLGIVLVNMVQCSGHPGLTPMDFYLRGHRKSIVYQNNIRNMNRLKRRITAACKQITWAAMTPVRQNWLERLSLCLDMGGVHVENIL